MVNAEIVLSIDATAYLQRQGHCRALPGHLESRTQRNRLEKVGAKNGNAEAIRDAGPHTKGNARRAVKAEQPAQTGIADGLIESMAQPKVDATCFLWFAIREVHHVRSKECAFPGVLIHWNLR